MGAIPLAEGARPQVAVRAFFGLPLPDAQRAALAGFVAECAPSATDFRWTPPANLHLTVRFIGRVELGLVEAITDRLAGRSLPAVSLELGDLGAFKRGRLVRVVWLGLRSGAEELASLAAQVDAECAAAGLPGEERPFRAHLTLARARPREGAALGTLAAPPRLSPWRAGELVLYSSRLSRAGAVYEPLRAVQLD